MSILAIILTIALMIGVALLVTFLPLPPVVFTILNIAVFLYIFVVTASFWGAGGAELAELVNKIPWLGKIAAVGVGISVGNLIGGLLGIKRL